MNQTYIIKSSKLMKGLLNLVVVEVVDKKNMNKSCLLDKQNENSL